MIRSLQQLIAADITREQLEEFCRSEAKSVSVSGDPPLVLSRVLGKYLMYSLARDHSITPHLAMSGIWEPWVTMAIARHLQPGMSCLDVGACYGYFTVLMGDLVGDGGRVEAYEPLPELAELASLNASLNGLTVDVQNAAVGTHLDGVVPIAKRRRSDSVVGLFNGGGTKCRPSVFRDNLFVPSLVPVGHYDFIKIDAEGAETDVWQALELGKSMLPATVCMEFTPREHASPKEFLELVMKQGFELGTVCHDGYPRPCSIDEALIPDTGSFRMLWLTRK